MQIDAQWANNNISRFFFPNQNMFIYKTKFAKV